MRPLAQAVKDFLRELCAFAPIDQLQNPKTWGHNEVHLRTVWHLSGRQVDFLARAPQRKRLFGNNNQVSA
jgi:hypothetical protein